MKTLHAFLVFFLFIIVLSSCSTRQVNIPQQDEPVLNTADAHDAQKPPKEDFIIGFNPLKDDPENPSPHNPLVKKFGDIPEVRTYIRFEQKLHKEGLTLDELIELRKAEVHLYPSDAGKAGLKELMKEKERYQRLGIDMGGIVASVVDKKEDKDTD